MGEAKRKLSTTRAFIEKYPDCFFCGGRRRSTTREHMPPKSLFDNSHRPDKLVMPACDECNRTTSTADLTVSVISRWAYSSQAPENLDHQRLVARLWKQAPELIEEWSPGDPVVRERGRERLRARGVPLPDDAGVAQIGLKTIRQLNLLSHKLALALYFEHFKKPLPVAGRVSALWKTKEDFIARGFPWRLLDIFPQYGTLTQGGWNEHEVFEYRHDINLKDGLFGCFAKLRGRLFIGGFAVTDASILPIDKDDIDWISPNDPTILLKNPRFNNNR